MAGGIVAQYGFLYQKFVFVYTILNNIGANNFFTYEGADDIDVTIDIKKNFNKLFFYTITDSQRCTPDFIANFNFPQGKILLSMTTLSKVLKDLNDFSYFVDDRNWTWSGN